MPDLNIPQPITEGYVANLKQELTRLKQLIHRQDMEYGNLHKDHRKLLTLLMDLGSGYSRPGSLEMVIPIHVEHWFENHKQEELALAT